MWREEVEVFHYDNAGGHSTERTTLNIQCKMSEVPQIRQALREAQARGDGAGMGGERVGDQGGLTRSVNDMKEIVDEMKTMARGVNELREALVEKMKNLEERVCMLEEPEKGLEATRVARKDTSIVDVEEEGKGRNRRSRRQKAAAAKAAKTSQRAEEEI